MAANDLLGDDERPYGGGLCAVPDCPIPTKVNVLTCAGHWRRIPTDKRNAVLAAWRHWQENRGTLGDLRDAQRAAIEAVAR